VDHGKVFVLPVHRRPLFGHAGPRRPETARTREAGPSGINRFRRIGSGTRLALPGPG